MNHIQKQQELLLQVKDHQSLEFIEGLQTLLSGIYQLPLADVAPLIETFYADILAKGIFYINILNDNLLFLLKHFTVLTPLQANLFMFILERILPIANRQTENILKIFSEKLGEKNDSMLSQIQELKKAIQKQMEVFEQQVNGTKLHPYKNIIDEYYP